MKIAREVFWFVADIAQVILLVSFVGVAVIAIARHQWLHAWTNALFFGFFVRRRWLGRPA